MRILLSALCLAANLSVVAAEPAPTADFKSSVLRLNSTVQAWSAGQPWEKSHPSNHRALAALIPGGKVERLEGAGHMLMAERPQQVLKALRDYSAGIG